MAPPKRAKLGTAPGDHSGTKIRGRRVVVDADEVLEPGYIIIVGGLVAEIGRDESLSGRASACEDVLDAELVVPGFVDIHTHGIGGADEIGNFWQNPEYTLSRVVKYGTTSLLATVILPMGTGSEAQPRPARAWSCLCKPAFGGCSCQSLAPDVKEAVPRIAARLNSVVGALGHGAVLEGIHAEGPIVATLGGLPRSDAAMPLPAFARLLDILGPGTRLMTISPSEEARTSPPYQKIRLLLDRGIKPALGHDTACALEDILGALRLAASMGATLHITHCFNVQTFHHRACGLANVALLPSVPALAPFAGVTLPTIELIGDSVHVSPLVLQVACACKPAGTACFITDGIAEPKLGNTLLYDSRRAEVRCKDGLPAVYSTSAVDGHEVLVGSCVMMVDAFRTALTVLQLDVKRAVDMCCCTPAKVASLPHVGSLRPGRRADVVCLGSDLDVQKVLVAGQIVHDCAAPSEGQVGE